MNYDSQYSINTSCFWIQQAIEKVMKGYMHIHGMYVRKTNNIATLIRISECSGTKCIITDWVRDNADTISSWITEARYNDDFYISREDLIDALLKTKEFMCANGVIGEYLPEVTIDVRIDIAERLHLNAWPIYSFDWNPLYISNRYKLGYVKKTKPRLDFDLTEYMKNIGVTDYAKFVQDLKRLYGTKDVNAIKCKLKEAYDKADV